MSQTRTKGYWMTFGGALAGVFVTLTVFQIVTLSVGFLALQQDWRSGEAALGLMIWGPVLAVPFGSALGIFGALRVSGYRAPVATALFSLPIAALVLFSTWSLLGLVDTMDFGWLMIIPPLVIPFLARRAALWAQEE